MELLKSNTELRLIPIPNLSRPLEKLGIVFVNSVLSSTVTQFLNNHGVVKDFVAAVNLAALQPLSDDEAKSEHNA